MTMSWAGIKALLNVLYHTYNGLIFHRKTCTICDQ